MNNRYSWMLGAALMAIFTGCNRPARPTPAPATHPASASRAAPAWKEIQVADYPLAIRVPKSWSVEPVRTVLFLQGPIPSGAGPEKLVHAQVSRQTSVPSRELMQARLDGEKQVDPGEKLIKLDVRQAGTSTILEKRIRQDGKDGLPDRIVWSLTTYVPSQGDAWVPYHIEFIDLTVQEYERDHSMLERIVSSLRVDMALSPHDAMLPDK